MHNAPDEILYAGRHLAMVRRDGWEFASRGEPRADGTRVTGVVGIVATTEAGELVLVEQHRPAAGGRVIELPAGLVGDDGEGVESPEAAAARELEEETGYRAAAVRFLLTGLSSAGLSDERVELFRATGLERVGEGGGGGGERISVHAVPVAGVNAWLRKRCGWGDRSAEAEVGAVGETVGGAVGVDLKVWAALWAIGAERSVEQEARLLRRGAKAVTMRGRVRKRIVRGGRGANH